MSAFLPIAKQYKDKIEEDNTLNVMGVCRSEPRNKQFTCSSRKMNASCIVLFAGHVHGKNCSALVYILQLQYVPPHFYKTELPHIK